MQYICRQRLNVQTPDRSFRAYVPGEVVDGFLTWSIQVRRAHLQMGFIEELADGAHLPPQPVASGNDTPVTMRCRVSKEPPYVCTDCTDREFGNYRNLMIHRARKHPKA